MQKVVLYVRQNTFPNSGCFQVYSSSTKCNTGNVLHKVSGITKDAINSEWDSKIEFVFDDVFSQRNSLFSTNFFAPLTSGVWRLFL